MTWHWLDVVAVPLQALVLFFPAYNWVIGLAGIRRRRPAPTPPPHFRFAFCIPAHNEAAVVGHLVRCLLGEQRYPRDLFDVFVVADNCTDNTAAVAREAGATVYERHDRQHVGKGYALNFLFAKVLGHGAYDAVAVVDADNLVHPDFLRHMNAALLRGERVIQGYLDTKNPDDTWVSRAIYLTYKATNRLWQLARQNLGLSCALGGTGLVIRAALLARYPWDGGCLTEDLEYGARITLAGYRVAWSHEAIVYDEKPLTVRAGFVQRERWMRGHFDVLARYFVPLMRRAVARGDWRAFDMAVYLAQPARSVLLMATGAFMFAQMGFRFFRMVPWWTFLVPIPAWGLWGVLQFAMPLAGLALEGVPLRRAVGWVLLPLWSTILLPVAPLGLLRFRNRTWNHTRHQRALTLADVEHKRHGTLTPEEGSLADASLAEDRR